MLKKRVIKKAILNMKCQTARMLCFSLYCVLTTGCGKKIENSEQELTEKKLPLVTNTYELQAKFFTTGDSVQDKLVISKDAWVSIPEKLNVLQGNGGNQVARLYFNVKDEKYEFFCDYVGGANSINPIDEAEIARGKEYLFDGCYQDIDFDGKLDNLNYGPGLEVAHDNGNSIILDIKGADDRENNITATTIDIEFI